MSELLALGISHKTAPVALRERLAFTEAEGVEFARTATATDEVREAVVISTCNRTEVYLVVGDPVQAEGDMLEPAGPARGDSPNRAGRGDLFAAQLRRRPPALPRHRRPRVDDRRRGRDPGAGQACPRSGRGGGLHGPAVQPPLHSRADDRQAGALGDRARASRVSVPSVAVDLALSVLGELDSAMS